MLYVRATRWLSVQQLERRIALLALLFALPSLASELQADDYLLREQLMQDGPLAAYVFTPRTAQARHELLLEQRSAGRMPWWADEHVQVRFFRPLSSLSLWLDFASGAPPWWMHLENCAIYAAIVWLAVAIYRQLGLTGAGLGWAALFFGLDMAFATPVGWISARNTLLAACFGFACILLHGRARNSGRPVLLALACVCFALSLLSAELGLCALGYVAAHALAVDRAAPWRRALVLSPYAVLAGSYLAFYIGAGYGVSHSAGYIDVVNAPGDALLNFVESIPVWLATTATLPLAGLRLVAPEARLPLLIASLVVLAVLLPLLAAHLREQRSFCVGALLSLVPLATVMPQDRLRFFVALGVYGVLGAWVATDYDARERLRRSAVRVMWRLHGVILPLFFVPQLFSVGLGFAGGGADSLDRAVPRAAAPITIILNPPSWYVPLYQAAMRAARAEPRPPTFQLYAGSQALQIARTDDRTLEIYAARGWCTTPLEGFRDLERSPFHVGERFTLAHLTVEVLELDARSAPTRVRFKFDRPLEDPGITFRAWSGSNISAWTPPPVGGRLQLTAAGALVM